MNKNIVTAILLFAFPACFSAQGITGENESNSGLLAKGPAADPCDGYTRADLESCAAKDYEEADAALNKAYKEAMARLDASEQKEKLKEAQRAWIKFRDLHCECEYLSWDGGSIAGLARINCLTSLTNERTGHLKALANPEGDGG